MSSPAVYGLTITANSDPCAMRLGSVWDLDPEGLIAREFIYYDTHSIFNCRWAA